MLVKEGYKETEIGVIPEDWSVKPMEELTSLMTNGFVGTIKNQYVPSGTGVLYLQGFNVKENSFDLTGVTYVSRDFHKKHKKSELRENDLLTVQTGNIGITAYLPQKFEGANCQALIISRFLEKYDSRYWSYYFNSTIGRKALLEIETGSTMKHINVGDMKTIYVPVPKNKEEQQKIAEALSDMDNLISSLEKLIEKKKAVKQGAMQELLTGKKRLPGFSGEWTKMNLAKKSKIKARIGWQGLTTAEYLDSGYSYLVTGTDFKNGFIDWDDCHYVEKTRFDQDKNIQIQNDDILITKDGSLGKVAYVSGLSKPATLNSGVFVIRPIQNAYDTRFVYYVFSSFVFKEFLEQLSAGSTIIHLYQKDMNKFEIYIPDDIKEQKAIADILFDMDAEITALEHKLAKCQKLKQGMMQQLLTGKIRLVPNDDEVTYKPEVETLKVSTKGHNHQFDDAVVIAGIVDKFYSDKYPLGRKKVQKLLYLFRRHQEADTSAFKKKAAGPYADEVRYKGGEPIAISSKYISVKRGNKGSSFSKGEKIVDALTYLENWNLNGDLKWLCEHFKYIKTDRLELLATVDMAMCDLGDAGITVTVDSIKELIKSHSEWKAKLSKSYFKDNDIAWAIRECRRLFG